MEDLKNELQKLSEDPSLSKAYRNRKLVLYFIRTLIAIAILYFYRITIGSIGYYTSIFQLI